MTEIRRTHVRHLIVAMLFIASCYSYGDRSALSIASADMEKQFALSSVQLGFLFSGFGWAYVLAQLPCGALLDQYGAKRIYGLSIIGWTTCAVLIGCTGYLPAAWVVPAIFSLRLLSGLSQAPVFPGNGRIVAAWFPVSERGRASATFNSSQYFALVTFAPLFSWLTHSHGWQSCFWFMGAFGYVLAFVWFRTVHDVKNHPKISRGEVEHIENGGGLLHINRLAGSATKPLTLTSLGYLLSQRMLLGIYLGQFCITTLTYFFITWFPVYLMKARHMSLLQGGFAVALPALCGSVGGLLGGTCSDLLVRRGHSLNFARKAPIIAGMLLSTTMILCSYTASQTLVVVLMSISFFGKGFGALGWTVIADTSPRELIGVNGGVFNLFGNLAGITTPLIIGLLVAKTGNYEYALLFVAAAAIGAIVSYLFVVGPIHRLEYSEKGAQTA